MKMKDSVFSQKIVDNIRKIMRDRNLTQVTMAGYMKTSESQFSKILSGNVQVSLWQLENLASNLSLREIDIITYPEVYVKKEELGEEPVEAVLQIKLQKEKKDQVLKLVFGENNIEILNR